MYLGRYCRFSAFFNNMFVRFAHICKFRTVLTVFADAIIGTKIWNLTAFQGSSARPQRHIRSDSSQMISSQKGVSAILTMTIQWHSKGLCDVVEFLVFRHKSLDRNNCISRGRVIENMENSVTVDQITRELPMYGIVCDPDWPQTVSNCQ